KRSRRFRARVSSAFGTGAGASTVVPANPEGTSSMLAGLVALLAAAPHRLLFFAGAAAVMVSMLWWTCVLFAAYFRLDFPAAPVPAGWAHAVLTQYGMLPPFIFG